MLLAVAGAPLLTGLAVALAPSEALAQSRSSGGYSRPSSSSSRTPSFSAPRPSTRTPSTSGGYARPSPSGSSRPSVAAPWFSPSAGDRAVSRQQSGSALGTYRAQQDSANRPSAPASSSGGWNQGGTQSGSPGGGQWGGPTGSQGGSQGGSWFPSGRSNQGSAPVIRQAERPGWYSRNGWTAPSSIFGPPRSFGIWDGLFLYALVSNLSRPSTADFFHNRQNDPGTQQWRAEADRLARDNKDLRLRLEELDRQVATRKRAPVDPNYLPPDIPPGVALAMPVSGRTPSTAPANDNQDGTPWTLIAIVVGGAIVAWVLWRRIRKRGGGDGGSMNILGSAGAMLRRKISGEAYKPSRFRVGMTVPFDPTPFVLAQGATKVVAPQPDTDAMRLTVTAVGAVTGDGVELTRLYLPDARSMFQLHTDADGAPDECRFFSRIDEITPADGSEWDFWLHPAEGIIGWPQFQTKDGKMYDRVWSPGPTRVPPLDLTETMTVANASGPDVTQALRRQSMLYAAPTGAPSPAPATEYILVSVIEAGGQAWVEIAAGMDVNPGMLELS